MSEKSQRSSRGLPMAPTFKIHAMEAHSEKVSEKEPSERREDPQGKLLSQPLSIWLSG